MENPKFATAAGMDLAGYRSCLSQDGVRHTRSTHGDDGKQRRLGQRGVVAADFQHVGAIVRAPDLVTKGRMTRRRRLQALVAEKAVRGMRYTVVFEIQRGRRVLAIQTMFKRPG